MPIPYESISRQGWGPRVQPNTVTTDELQAGALIRIAGALEKIEEHLFLMTQDARVAAKEKASAERQRREKDAGKVRHWMEQFTWPTLRCEKRVYWAAMHVLEDGGNLNPEMVLKALHSVRYCGAKTIAEAKSVLFPAVEQAAA